jgi:hypothetical protein
MTFEPNWLSLFLTPVILRWMFLHAETANAKRKPGIVIFPASGLSEQSRARLLHRNRGLAARRSMDEDVHRIDVGGLLVVDLANHSCAQRQWTNGKAYLEANPLNSLLGNRVRVPNGRPPPSCTESAK